MINLSPATTRFTEVVLAGALWGGLTAVANNIAGAGLVSSGVALAITAVIGVLEQQFNANGTKALFGAVRVR